MRADRQPTIKPWRYSGPTVRERLRAAEADCDALRERVDKLVSAVREIEAKASPFSEDGDGFVASYVMPVGPLHRALGLVAGEPFGESECRIGSTIFHVLLGDRHEDGQWDAVLVPQPPDAALAPVPAGDSESEEG